MKGLLMDALAFPRKYIRSNLFILDCCHGGNFQAGEQHCESCENKEACQWLYSNDECSNVEGKSAQELVQSLQYSLDYIDTDVADMGHNIGTCHCDTCLWLKNAENLVSLYQNP